MMSLWDALRMNMMISYQELVRTFLSGARFYQKINTGKFPLTYAHNQSTKNVFVSGSKVLKL
ncbi:hypothetical protein U4Z39_21760, partial [Escherichia coli]|nr:hypothetical protein [Escherichia coli]